ncbi:hypothetical protein ILUMI_06427 [Ignelater luminosus]|uniref:Uncharacterized protein n=1 Tax=Ignelater luminosus TaxID=2038154 RepID=A0A8K0GJ24_IGNLU|nr:hypothetical protein ILUMI_06427 [Ignelater luminosus]
MCDSNLITTYSFHGRPFLVKMSVVNCSLELILTDKQTGEEWECNYDVSYIENLTRKTGNFKQFQIFTAMIRSGLLKTSDCICLDLLTYEDLEALRIRRIRNHHSSRTVNQCNRRYLIVTYSVEFDKINYPLPLQYCGFPDPIILQDTIRRLELELSKANEELEQRNHSNEKQKIKMLQNR